MWFSAAPEGSQDPLNLVDLLVPVRNWFPYVVLPSAA